MTRTTDDYCHGCGFTCPNHADWCRRSDHGYDGCACTKRLERLADQGAHEAARLQAVEGVTERVEQMYADARALRAKARR